MPRKWSSTSTGCWPTQFATFPIGTSSGAFSFQIDESTGLPVRRTRSFGPSFGERTLTVGRGRFSSGASYQHTSYNQFEGENAHDGSCSSCCPHNDCCPAQVGLQATGDGNLLNPGLQSDIVTVRAVDEGDHRHRGVLCDLRHQ